MYVSLPLFMNFNRDNAVFMFQNVYFFKPQNTIKKNNKKLQKCLKNVL